jgi:beta-lactamase superfamily II metal-dependent hydrolase
MKERPTIRTYRHGLGDCHLVSIYRKDEDPYRILIDCGVILGTADAKQTMCNVMADILAETGGKVDILVATHEHGDHISGFVQAADQFSKLQVDNVWMAWTEDERDELATTLRKDRNSAQEKLQRAAARLQIEGNDYEDSHPVLSLLEFFGAAGQATTKSALEAVRAKSTHPRYCDPKDPPFEIPGADARIYVLGPPRDLTLLKKTSPSKSAPETYSLALQAFEESVANALDRSEEQLPFSGPFRIPMNASKGLPFFQRNYWDGEPWRRIDVAWMDDATQFALALDNMTNNTSLVLAIELEQNDVLLFAADAQVGNWLSWHNCSWKVQNRTISGNDLLKRTIVYKVGHHGSHNATLREQGLELMDNLNAAIIPVDHQMALKKRWGNIPLGSLEEALVSVTTGNGGFVLRADKPLSAEAIAQGVIANDLYFEFEV